jgi:hypothetical protein
MAKVPPKPGRPIGRDAAPRLKLRGAGRSGNSSIMEALSALTEIDPSPEHFIRYDEEASAEKNDRGAAILIATNLENALETAIVRHLRLRRRSKKLFGFNAPFGTFDFKIRVGHAFGLFKDETEANLHTIRAIRNAFAHAKVPVKFSDAAVTNACALLTVPNLVSPVSRPAGLPPETEEQKNALVGRERFRRVCQDTSHNLLIRSFYGPLAIDRAAIKGDLPEGYIEIWALVGPLP